MKKLLLLGAIAAVGYFVYRQRMASRAEDDLWSEATAAPDLTAAYQPAVVEDVVDSVDHAPEAEVEVEELSDTPEPTDHS